MAFLASLDVFSLNSSSEEWRMCMGLLPVFLGEVDGVSFAVSFLCL